MDSVVTRRLHVSGLTPAITKDDLANRLSPFGTIKALDGFGLLDGVGRPRKFAYVTIEATPAKLAKCLNVLSGSIWRGTKLRLGEAKPDFAQRISSENKRTQELSRTLAAKRARQRLKRRRLYTARHASDMSLTTPESAARKGGWTVTPLGRVYIPLRIRPLCPLPPPITSAAAAAAHIKANREGKGKGRYIKQRKKLKKLDVRARRRKIDMTRWGSVHIKGRFLDADVPLGFASASTKVEDTRGYDARDEEMDTQEENSDADNAKPRSPIPPPLVPQPARHLLSAPHSTTTLTKANSDADPEFAIERQHSLNILASLFGPTGADDVDDWIGRESLGSDIEDIDIMSGQRVGVRPGDDDISGGDGQFEVVSRGDDQHIPSSAGVDEDVNMDEQETEARISSSKAKPPIRQIADHIQLRPTANLKELFAPREEEGGFSLLDHLDLELELDETVPFPVTQEAQAEYEYSVSIPASGPVTIIPTPATMATATKPQRRSHTQLDPTKPFFFPFTMLSSHPHSKNVNILTTTNARDRPKDLFDVLKARAWDWRSGGFYRTLSEDEVRQRWDEQKGELTREWKKRFREAGRAGRRRGKGEGEGVE